MKEKKQNLQTKNRNKAREKEPWMSRQNKRKEERKKEKEEGSGKKEEQHEKKKKKREKTKRRKEKNTYLEKGGTKMIRNIPNSRPNTRSLVAQRKLTLLSVGVSHNGVRRNFVGVLEV